MQEQINIIVTLQEIDTQAGHLESRLNDVSNRIARLDEELNQFEQAITDEESTVSDLKKKYRDYESDAQLNLSRVNKIQAKLRAVKTNKEYQALLKEIEEVEAKNSEIEDHMLECLDRLDEAETTIKAKKQELTEFSERIKLEKEVIHQEAEQDRQELAKLDSETKEIYNSVATDLLEKYNSVKAQQSGGLAVVPVKNAVCYGCNMNIPPQMYNELQRQDALKFCPHCHRIIYWEESG